MFSSQNAAAKLIGKLIGLARATDGNEHLINADASAVIMEALSATLPNGHWDDASLERLCARVEEEKRKMVPDCFTCACPCGKNADFDMQDLSHDGEEVCSLKLLLLAGIRSMAADAWQAAALGCRDENVERFLYKALIVIGMDGWDTDRLLSILRESANVNLQFLALLNKANTTPASAIS